jgi:hypothetical protein
LQNKQTYLGLELVICVSLLFAVFMRRFRYFCLSLLFVPLLFFVLLLFFVIIVAVNFVKYILSSELVECVSLFFILIVFIFDLRVAIAGRKVQKTVDLVLF